MLKVVRSFISFYFHKFTSLYFPTYEMSRCYKQAFNKFPNLSNPKDLIEKIYWLQLHSDTTLWSECADKYNVRNYLKKKGLDVFLPINYGCWSRVNDIDLEILPESFVLKTNNATETCLIVKDKKVLLKDWDKVRNILHRWMQRPYGYYGAQLHYLRIKPQIIAEELLIPDEISLSISPNSLIDYKFFCAGGEPYYILTLHNRSKKDGVFFNIYDLNWNAHPEYEHSNHHHTYSSIEIPRPECLDKMLSVCRAIAQDFPQVRVDFYVIKNRFYIGEITLTTGYGYLSHEFYKEIGDKVDLSNVNIVK